jgi:hypothetical protein
MTSDTLVQKIPRTVVRMSLRATRLPLHAGPRPSPTRASKQG